MLVGLYNWRFKNLQVLGVQVLDSFQYSWEIKETMILHDSWKLYGWFMVRDVLMSRQGR